MQKRIEELDYLKCVFIILMIVFHLVYIGDKYPYAKDIVYTFHMSGFLVISGYLANVGKSGKLFLRDMAWVFLPYAFMEICYVLAASVLPVRESVKDIGFVFLVSKIFVSPMGPYWYFHTLLLCSIVYYLAYHIIFRGNISRFIFTGLFLFILSYVCGLLSFPNALYFLAGILIRQSKANFPTVFQPSFLGIIPLAILCAFPQNLDRGSLPGMAIAFFAISVLLCLYRATGVHARKILLFTGRNTLVILLFSPIFTMLSKKMLPLFSFDPTGMLFTLAAVLFAVSGSLFIAWAMDKLHVSKYFFGKPRAISI